MKKYKTNELYVARLYVVTNEEWNDANLTTKYTGEFLDYAIVKHEKDLVFSSIYKDVLTNRYYKTDANFQGQVYIVPKYLISLNEMIKNEKLTIKELYEALDMVKVRLSIKNQTTEKRLRNLGLVLANLISELGEEKASMILKQIIDELGMEKTEEITNPLSNELGYNVVEKAKNIERTRKK